MEKYNLYELDVPHTATSGIEVGRFQGMITKKLIGESLSLGAGEVALVLRRSYDLTQICFHLEAQAAKYTLEKRQPAIFIEDTNNLRPCDIEKHEGLPTTQWWPNGVQWMEGFTPVCAECCLNIFPGEQVKDGDRGYMVHLHCPAREEVILQITGFSFTQSKSVRAVLYKDLKGEEHQVPITVPDIRSHMSTESEQYLNKRAAFSCQSLSADGVMNAPEFLGLVYEKEVVSA